MYGQEAQKATEIAMLQIHVKQGIIYKLMHMSTLHTLSVDCET